MRSPLVMAGVSGSTVTLNWASEPLMRKGWYEVEYIELGERDSTLINSWARTLPDGTWTFRVTVYDGDGNSASSDVVTTIVDTKTPDVPVVSMRVDGIIVTLDWDTVLRAVEYEIICNTEWIGNVAGPPNALAGVHFVHHAWHDGVYHYQVRARDEVNRWSAFSKPVTHIVDSIPPKAPVLNVVTRGLQVQVQWHKPDGNPIQYQIRRNGEDIATVTGNKFRETVSQPGPYSYRVRSIDAEGRASEWSDVTPQSSVWIGSKDLGQETRYDR